MWKEKGILFTNSGLTYANEHTAHLQYKGIWQMNKYLAKKPTASENITWEEQMTSNMQ